MTTIRATYGWVADAAAGLTGALLLSVAAQVPQVAGLVTGALLCIALAPVLPAPKAATARVPVRRAAGGGIYRGNN
jgi:hypothetical protein